MGKATAADDKGTILEAIRDIEDFIARKGPEEHDERDDLLKRMEPGIEERHEPSGTSSLTTGNTDPAEEAGRSGSGFSEKGEHKWTRRLGTKQ